MRATLTARMAYLVREKTDKRIAHETTVAQHLKRLLNAQGFAFVRYNPSRENLTACTIGLIDHRRGIVLWHERYAVESLSAEFNHGRAALTVVNIERNAK